MGSKIDIHDRTLYWLSRGLFAAATVAVSLWSAAANADFAAGVAAYEAGDFAAAFEQWLPEAEAGNNAAQQNIRLLYQSGQGVEADAGQAVFWYQRTAEAGNARAQANLGNLYLSGDGMPQDYGVAANWFELAARQGHVVSQFNLGLMYENGLGVETNRFRALEWYAMAASLGHPAAIELHRILLAQRPPDPAPLPVLTPEPVVVAAVEPPPTPIPDPPPPLEPEPQPLPAPPTLLVEEAAKLVENAAPLMEAAADAAPAVVLNLDAIPEEIIPTVVVGEAQIAALPAPPPPPAPRLDDAAAPMLPIVVPDILAGIEVAENPGIAGLLAFRRGDYLTALANLLPAAVQGDPSAQVSLGGDVSGRCWNPT